MCGVLALLTALGCGGAPRDAGDTGSQPCAVALAPHAGESELDLEIARLQHEAAVSPGRLRALDRLGWAFVRKARTAYDPGYYRLADECARCLDEKQPGSPEALLLRGHVLHNTHRFREAEEIARKLVRLRGGPLDHALLGDALMEQGRLTEAAPAYQMMMDARPSLQAYSRAANLRWLTGDLNGAIELMTMAIRAGSPRDGESVAWCYSRLALFQLQAGRIRAAARACDAALSYEADYAPAFLARGRVLLARGAPHEAVADLRRAAGLNPLPEYRWTLADALRSAGSTEEAEIVEAKLAGEGASQDPRTFALYLSTRGHDRDRALQLAESELAVRSDVFTHDAVAWACAAAGRLEQARSSIRAALAHGTRDARLFLHAGLIAAAAGDAEEARRWLEKTSEIRQMLLPSERTRLQKELQRIS
jgi:tetratricopeptide (TPR) repeat protein